MKQILIPKKTFELTDLLEYSSIGFSPEIKLDGYVRYMSEYEKKTSKPSDNDWNYYINSYGYRGDWRLHKHTKKIGFFGCSVTFGIGVDSNYIFPNLVELHYGSNNVESLNLGMGGAGIQRIAKLVSASIRLINFDVVIMTLPTSSRFLVVDKFNQMIDIVPNFTRDECKGVEKFIYQNFGQNNLDMYFIDYIHWIESELKSVNTVLWTTWCKDTHTILEDVIDKNRLLPAMHFVDQGRDLHPGVLTHKKYAEIICNKLGNF
jgi:hypothetical protein